MTPNAWSEKDKELLVAVVKEHDKMVHIIKHFNELAEKPRGAHALANTIARLRQKGLLPHSLNKRGECSRLSYYSKMEVDQMISTLAQYWADKGYKTHEFYAERVTTNGYVIRSNLIGGIPPKTNPNQQ